MTWSNPLPYSLIPTSDPMSFATMPAGATGLPFGQHPGAFGVVRQHHRHEGLDLYVPACTPVATVEAGEVVRVAPFTGPHAGLPHWLDTYAVWVAGASGVVVYGEIAPHVKLGQKLVANEVVGVVLRVLRHDKGRPLSMLHLELRDHGNTADIEWLDKNTIPQGLLDPTPYLLPCAEAAGLKPAGAAGGL